MTTVPNPFMVNTLSTGSLKIPLSVLPGISRAATSMAATISSLPLPVIEEMGTMGAS